MKLIGSNTSPYVRKVRVVMAEKKIDCQYETDDVYSAAPKVVPHNPLGKVPCLITDDGGAVFDSRVIVEYLDNLTPVHRLIPPQGRARTEVRTLEALADGLLDAALLIRAEMTQRDASERSQKWVDRQRGKIDSALAAMSRTLADAPFFCENKYSLADVATGCALGYLDFRFPEIGWRDRHANLARYAEKLFTRASFVETMPG